MKNFPGLKPLVERTLPMQKQCAARKTKTRTKISTVAKIAQYIEAYGVKSLRREVLILYVNVSLILKKVALNGFEAENCQQAGICL